MTDFDQDGIGDACDPCPLVYNKDMVDTKVNYNISSKLAIFGKYSIMEAPVTSAGILGGTFGASLVSGKQAGQVVTNLRSHLPNMEGFHRRYMVSNKILRLWTRMARDLDISMIVPQHGSPMAGPAIREFFDWLEGLQCGIDLVDDRMYQLPRNLIDTRVTNSRY